MRDRTNTNASISSMVSTCSVSITTNRAGPSEKSSPILPPSPSFLPAQVIKENKHRLLSSPRRKMAAKLLIATGAIFLLWRCTLTAWMVPHQEYDPEMLQGPRTELLGSYDLPNEPAAFMVASPGGQERWTISIPRNRTFPLATHDYQDICADGVGFRDTINANADRMHSKHWMLKHVASTDRTFIDIQQAQVEGILPHSTQSTSADLCDTTMTFVLDSEEASFGKMLLSLWLSYGSAMKEGRAFFIDDSRWVWGKYASFFKAPPLPKCQRPEPYHIVPCPRNAKHLVVTSSTARWSIGSMFQEGFQARFKHGLKAQSPIFNLIRHGYEDLFKLTDDDSIYASQRIAGLQNDAVKRKDPVIGMQIRRGDRHPHEFQYNRDYLPLERYGNAAMSLWNKNASKSSTQPSFLIASDDPDMFTSDDLQQAVASSNLQRAQDRILLATKATLDQSAPVKSLPQDGSPYTKHVEENSGWEGGFFSALFYSVGGAKHPSQSIGDTDVIPEQALNLRELIGRAYLLDMAVMGSSDGVVCAISSASCRVLGVMMGWDAVKQGRWKNIDDGRSWSWDGERR